MERSLIWIDDDDSGWACSKCRWRFSVPTLLSGEEGMRAYDRLATAKFQEHPCEAEAGLSAASRDMKRAAIPFS